MSRPEVPTVVFVGQPNGGKSTLFNSLAGPKAETSNFPGTSVKHTHSRVVLDGRPLDIVDLPGTYSLCPADPAERVALTHLFSERPDLIVNVVDASTFSRGLELTLELIELGRPMVIALNMIDVAERRGVEIDAAEVERLLGVPVVPTIAAYGRGVRELVDRSFEVLDRGRPPRPPRYAADVEDVIAGIEQALPPTFPAAPNPRFVAVKLIEMAGQGCASYLGEVEPEVQAAVERGRETLARRRGAPAYEVIAAERHHQAMKLAEETGKVRHGRRLTRDKRIDAVLMHPFLGYVILAAVFLAFFFVIFRIGSPLETLLLKPFAALRSGLAARLGNGLAFYLAEGLVQGVGGGIGIVLPYFLPLLLLMAALEDSGYLARAGFLLDAFMHRIGLHGKSVSPFILGFGCNVPAIVSTRGLESRRDRVLTSILIPFIPCSARTTIVLALIAFYLGPLWAAGFYAANILVVALAGWAVSRFMTEPSPGLILEIPSLKAPRPGALLRKTGLQVLSFIRFAWPLLIGGSLVLSLLVYFRADRWINDLLAPLVVRGLGLPHELGVTLVFGFLRKELSLIMMLQALGVDYTNLLSVVSREQIVVFTVFISFFIPCLSTFVMLWKETGKKWAFVSAGLSIAVALALSWLVRLVL
ncbi:MAG TPA: ferrous iron transport protein B [Candidatus Aminicenantes bacterium]|nr:ferrous iron transport protein B [Candidatus Aminicenantes bacterium]HRY65943.1 ferrous iron transport protein B [Candidatus Aminicenantes bacterium]HRZ73008.1 ferrous iron transport protein B [Candidatus Aminicenantes bacterium]